MILEFEGSPSFIGANNSEKIAVLHAMLKLFGTRSKQREITRSDFHVPNDKKPEEIEKNSIYIGVFNEFEVKDWLGHTKLQSTMTYIKEAKHYFRLAPYDWINHVLKAANGEENTKSHVRRNQKQ